MAGERPPREEKPRLARMAALFGFGLLAFNPPLLTAFDKPTTVFGLSVLLVWIFGAWSLLILLVALAVERDHPGSGPDSRPDSHPDSGAGGRG
ncbi:hypothetical protein [Rhodocista pekingensis]|uniref:DUF3311 domain-containing protein n=1 Tax=Rhodocista pekingensis TaxID=201185 RepID=A0ABW2KRB0_9PROT